MAGMHNNVCAQSDSFCEHLRGTFQSYRLQLEMTVGLCDIFEMYQKGEQKDMKKGRMRENRDNKRETLGKRRSPTGKRGPHESEKEGRKEGSGTHVAETAPPLVFFLPAVRRNSSLKISSKRRRRSINKQGEERIKGGTIEKCTGSAHCSKTG